MFDESPPPYSAVAGTILVELPVLESPEAALPFGHSDQLVVKIQALVSEGQILNSRFKDIRDVASAGAKFEYQEHVVTLCQRFETLIWESRNTASIALVAIKDFNEVVLDFLSEPDVVVQDRLKELANSSRVLQRERESATKQKAFFDALIKELEDFHRMIQSELGALNPKRRRQSRSGNRGTGGSRLLWKSAPPFVVPHSEPLCGISTITASLGVMSRTCMDYALKFERIAEEVVFPSWVIDPPPEATPAPAQNISPGPPPLSIPGRKRFNPASEFAGLATLPGLVDTLVRDLRAFVSHIDVLDTVFAELARAQDIFVVYLKDGQSIANEGYRFEINRLRRHLPCVCNALDAYSKARLSMSLVS